MKILIKPWLLSIGPRRVNHASVAIDDFIYSFGGYCSGEDYRSSRPMDVHVLNTSDLRWKLLPIDKDLKYPKVPFQRYGKKHFIEILYKSSHFRLFLVKISYGSCEFRQGNKIHISILLLFLRNSQTFVEYLKSTFYLVPRGWINSLLDNFFVILISESHQVWLKSQKNYG